MTAGERDAVRARVGRPRRPRELDLALANRHGGTSEGPPQPCSGSGEKYLSNHVYTHCHTYIYIVEYIDKTVTSRWPIAMA